MHYVAVIERGKSGFGVFFPDIPGCTSGGDTVQEAAENAGEALALHLEDDAERPAPTDIEDIVVDPRVEVAAKVLVRAPDVDGPIERYSVTLPSGLVKRVDRRVGARRRSAFLADAVRKALVAG